MDMDELKVLTKRAVTGLDTCHVPLHMHGAIIRYYENGIEPGGFLTAVIDNDLAGAIGRADDTNVYRLKNFIQWFWNFAPTGTWGYPGAVRDYVTRFHNPQQQLPETES